MIGTACRMSFEWSDQGRWDGRGMWNVWGKDKCVQGCGGVNWRKEIACRPCCYYRRKKLKLSAFCIADSLMFNPNFIKVGQRVKYLRCGHTHTHTHIHRHTHTDTHTQTHTHRHTHTPTHTQTHTQTHTHTHRNIDIHTYILLYLLVGNWQLMRSNLADVVDVAER
jgi:hypothetical protein